MTAGVRWQEFRVRIFFPSRVLVFFFFFAQTGNKSRRGHKFLRKQHSWGGAGRSRFPDMEDTDEKEREVSMYPRKGASCAPDGNRFSPRQNI